MLAGAAGPGISVASYVLVRGAPLEATGYIFAEITLKFLKGLVSQVKLKPALVPEISCEAKQGF